MAIKEGYRAFKEARKSELLELVGTPGTENYDGYLVNEDTNTEFDELNAYDNFRKMERTDPVLSGMLKAVKATMLSVAPSIEPASKNNIDMKIAIEVEDALFRNPYFTYSQLMRDVFLYFNFGYTLMSKQYAIKDGKYTFRKFMYMKPETITEWHDDDNAELLWIKQLAYDSRTNSYEIYKPKAWQLFHIANEQEGNNYRGRSLIRSAWRSYINKDQHIKQMGIQGERGAVGIPEAELINTNAKDQMVTVLEGLRTHQKAYAIRTRDFKIGFIGGKDFFGFDLLPYVKYHDSQMSHALLSHFILQGVESVGSRAKQSEDIDFFREGLEFYQKQKDDVFNEGSGNMQHIKQLVGLNYPNVTQFPKLRSGSLKEHDMESLSGTIERLFKAGIKFDSAEDIHFWRNKLGMPEKSIEEIEEEMESVQEDIDSDLNKDVEPEFIDDKRPDQIKLQASRRGKKVTPELLQFEKTIMNLAEIDTKTMDARNRLKEITRSFRNVMVTDLIERAKKILSKGKDVKQVSKMTQDTLITNKGQLVNAIVSESKDLFRYGQQTIKDEVAKQKSTVKNQNIVEDISEAFKSIRPTTEAEVAAFVEKLKAVWTALVLNQFKTGEIDTNALREGMRGVSQNVFDRTVARIATEAFGLGRGVQIEKLKKPTDRFIRSEVLDDNTCPACFDADGLEFSGTNDPDFAPFSRGVYNNCSGGNLCRGLNVIIIGT
jgi:hypothetical protein